MKRKRRNKVKFMQTEGNSSTRNDKKTSYLIYAIIRDKDMKIKQNKKLKKF